MEIFDYELPTIWGFQLPKLAVVVTGAIAFYYIAVFFMRVGMSGLAGMMSVGRKVAEPNATPRRPTTTGGSAGSAVGFNRAVVNAAGADWDEVQTVNAVLAQLQERKKTTLQRQNDQLTSRAAWLVVVFEQAILYRITALVGGAIAMWDARNPLGATLSARSLLESGALMLAMARDLECLAEAGKLAEMDAYVTERAFVTQPGGWIEQARRARPVETLALIDAADRVCAGTRFCYDRLSEIAGPEALGQYAVFGAIDKSGTAVEFRDIESLDPSTFRLILNAARIVVPVAAALESIEALTTRTAALEQA
ncbi:MAG: hypothetical protein ACJ8AW_34785 [Rhodopila sp.]